MVRASLFAPPPSWSVPARKEVLLAVGAIVRVESAVLPPFWITELPVEEMAERIADWLLKLRTPVPVRMTLAVALTIVEPLFRLAALPRTRLPELILVAPL